MKDLRLPHYLYGLHSSMLASFIECIDTVTTSNGESTVTNRNSVDAWSKPIIRYTNKLAYQWSISCCVWQIQVHIETEYGSTQVRLTKFRSARKSRYCPRSRLYPLVMCPREAIIWAASTVFHNIHIRISEDHIVTLSSRQCSVLVLNGYVGFWSSWTWLQYINVRSSRIQIQIRREYFSIKSSEQSHPGYDCGIHVAGMTRWWGY